MQLQDDLIFVLPPTGTDLDGAKLRRMMHVHIAWLEVRSAREWLLRILVCLSVPVWANAAWPASFPPRLHHVAIETWAASLGCLTLVILVEWWCRRLRYRYLQEFSPVREVDR